MSIKSSVLGRKQGEYCALFQSKKLTKFKDVSKALSFAACLNYYKNTDFHEEK